MIKDNVDRILIGVIIIITIASLIATVVVIVQKVNQPKEEPQTNVAAHYVVGEDNVTGIEIVYHQTHDLVDELIIYKDDTAVARRSKQHIYITPSQCKLTIYRGE